MVTKYKTPVWSDSKKAYVEPKMNWLAVGKELRRLPRTCTIKWESLEGEKKGRFSPEEDAQILQRVEEWGEKGKGLWVALSDELSRTASSVRARWMTLQAKRKPLVFWNEEMVHSFAPFYDHKSPT